MTANPGPVAGLAGSGRADRGVGGEEGTGFRAAADALVEIREFGYGKGRLPILVMTGDDNARNQAALLRSGANDLVQKPIEERLLVTKLLFQLRVAQHLRQRDGID